jgi:hypothetical protein
MAGAVVTGAFDAVEVVAGAFDDARVGAVPAPGVEVLFRVMPAMTASRMRFCCSGGKGRRVGGPAADDPDGALELDAVGVDVCLGGGPADL